MALRDPQFVAWGVEMNPVLCRMARARIRRHRLARQVRVIEGSLNDLRRVLPPKACRQITGVTASHLVNELFGKGTREVVRWLRRLRLLLPNRLLLITDYYGRLGANAHGGHRETVLHDYIQLISGQGVPPRRFSDWRSIYAEAGCRVVHVMEDRHTTMFIHVVKL
jgi:hypothetical protein